MSKRIKIIFRPHPELEGKHALLSPSKYHWVKDDKEKYLQRINNEFAKQRGNELHELAKTLIKLRIKIKEDKTTFGMYVNDAIDFRMLPEIPVKYSNYCFGTVDAVCYNERKSLLRIHDLKTGTSPVNVLQLMLYAAIICLDNNVNPNDISFELRIYQNNDYKQWNPTGEEIGELMSNIIEKNEWTEDIFIREE